MNRDETEFVTYRGDRIPHPDEQRRSIHELMKDMPDDLAEIPPHMEAAISAYCRPIHDAIDARVAADMMRDPDPAWRKEALEHVNRLRDRTLASQAAALLEDESAGVRCSAVLLMRKLRCMDAVPIVARLLRTDPKKSVRSICAFALQKLRTDEAFEALIAALASERADDEYANVASGIVLALRDYADPRAIEPLMRVAQSHAVWEGRYHALRTLDDMGYRDARMPAALDLLESDEPKMVELREIEASIAALPGYVPDPDDPDYDDEPEEPGKPYECFDSVIARLRREISPDTG